MIGKRIRDCDSPPALSPKPWRGTNLPIFRAESPDIEFILPPKKKVKTDKYKVKYHNLLTNLNKFRLDLLDCVKKGCELGDLSKQDQQNLESTVDKLFFYHHLLDKIK